MAYVVVVTWIVGIGRYWDSPDTHLVQKLGLGSVAYLFGMSVLLWVFIAPISNRRPYRYLPVLIFVGMTSLPAILYAIPVEMFLSTDGAAEANLLFLIVVAAWRVALLAVFCYATAGLSAWGTMTATLLPLTGIMIVLAMFSLEHVTFDLMAGMHRVDEAMPRSASGEIASRITAAAGWSHSTIATLRFFSWILFPIFLISWVIKAVSNRGPASTSNEE